MGRLAALVPKKILTVFAANPTATPPEVTSQGPSSTVTTIPAPEEQSVQPVTAPEGPTGSREVAVAPTTQASEENTRLTSTGNAEKIDVQSQIHGHRFQSLPAEEGSLLARLHKNLGHP